jgi:hypothetical protein
MLSIIPEEFQEITHGIDLPNMEVIQELRVLNYDHIYLFAEVFQQPVMVALFN